MLWLCLKLPSCLFCNTRDTSVMHEKANFVCFVYLKPQKVKFKSVQINMELVSYRRFAPDSKQFLETRSRVNVNVTGTQGWCATLYRSKMHPHAKLRIPTLTNIADMLWRRLF